MKYKKITVKIGSNVLTKSDGTLNKTHIAHLVDQIAHLRQKGVEIVLVSSGAVAAGRTILQAPKNNDAVSTRQLWSAIGQVKLIDTYRRYFESHKILCAQVLTTKDNFGSRRHYLNMKNCIDTLLENGVVPIVNENDTISISELMFTDNDELSGLIASIANSEALIILSNIDGVYDGHPNDAGSKLIEEISDNGFNPEESISPEISGFGRGGMITKYRIAKKVAYDGIGVHIANGTKENMLNDLLDSSQNIPHTFFTPGKKTASGVKRWIAYSDSFAKGHLVINDGACKALFSEKAVSLLPVGVTKVVGDFKKGDLVKIYNEKNNYLGLGKAQFGSDKMSKEQKAEKQKPIIHYDYMYIEDFKINSELC